MRKRHPQGRRHGWIAYAVGLPLAVVMIAPFLYMVATALTSEPDSLRHLVPEHVAAALAALPFGRFLFTSVIFSLAVVAGQVVTSATAAYAFARLRFPGRARQTRRARVRRSVAELCVAARGHPLERDAAARGWHREPAGHVRPELVRPDGDRGGGGDTADGALFAGPEVFHSRH